MSENYLISSEKNNNKMQSIFGKSLMSTPSTSGDIENSKKAWSAQNLESSQKKD